MSNKNVVNNRISLRFNVNDEEHVRALLLLKQLGRKKSAFITNAIIYYIENSPEFSAARNKGEEELTELAVNTVLGKRPAVVLKPDVQVQQANPNPTPKPKPKVVKEPSTPRPKVSLEEAAQQFTSPPKSRDEEVEQPMIDPKEGLAMSIFSMMDDDNDN